MIRWLTAVLAIALVVAVVVDLAGGGRPGPARAAVTLVAQRAPVGVPGAGWTTTRRIDLACAGSVGHGASPAALCQAVAYYTQHAPTSRCFLRGLERDRRRILITGRVDGRAVRMVIGPVCNPAAALAAAVQTISVAAFGRTG